MKAGGLMALVEGIMAGYQGVPMRSGERLQAVGFGIRHEHGCPDERPVVVMRESGRRLHCRTCDAWGIDEVWVEQ